MTQLSHLFRTGAEAAKTLAWGHPQHASAMFSLARRAAEMADEVDEILGDSNSSAH